MKATEAKTSPDPARRSQQFINPDLASATYSWTPVRNVEGQASEQTSSGLVASEEMRHFIGFGWCTSMKALATAPVVAPKLVNRWPSQRLTQQRHPCCSTRPSAESSRSFAQREQPGAH